MKKIGVIGIPDGWSSRVLADTLKEKTGEGVLVDCSRIWCDVGREEVYCADQPLSGFDALIIKKIGKSYSPHFQNRLSILSILERRGVRLFSSPVRIKGLINRLDCTLQLRAAGLPVPDTVISEDAGQLAAAVHRFGKAVLKPLYTSKARGMVVIEAAADTRRIVEDFLEHHPMGYVQRFVPIPGRDLGISFLGGKYLGTYARVGQKGQWNTTTHSGGSYESYDPSDELIELARRAQEVFGLDFTCVDLVETNEGPRIFEVSAFGGFRGLSEARGINVADLYVDYVLESLSASS